jgi:hypothetical protein
VSHFRVGKIGEHLSLSTLSAVVLGNRAASVRACFGIESCRTKEADRGCRNFTFLCPPRTGVNFSRVWTSKIVGLWNRRNDLASAKDRTGMFQSRPRTERHRVYRQDHSAAFGDRQRQKKPRGSQIIHLRHHGPMESGIGGTGKFLELSGLYGPAGTFMANACQRLISLGVCFGVREQDAAAIGPFH